VTVYTWSEINTALSAGVAMTAEVAGQLVTDAPFPGVCADLLARLCGQVLPWEEVVFTAPVSYDAYLFTAEQVSAAVNRAVDVAVRGERRRCNDRDDLIVNCVVALLEDPGADFTDVAYSCYGQSPDTIAGWARRAA